MSEFKKEIDMGDMKKSYFENFLNHIVFNKTHEFIDVNNTEISSDIRMNYSLLKSDDSYLFNVFKKITPREKMLKDILTYEFLFYNPLVKTKTIEDLLKMTFAELQKYQGIVGGFYIEDNTWIINDSESKSRFKISESQTIIYNSVEKDRCYDRDQIWFLRNFVIHMKKFIDPSLNVNIEYRLIDDESNQICWILIIFDTKK